MGLESLSLMWTAYDILVLTGVYLPDGHDAELRYDAAILRKHRVAFKVGFRVGGS